MGAPKGSKNAAKAAEQVLSATLLLRCKATEKTAWVNAAGGKKLAEWVRETLNAGAGVSAPPP